ncbi:MAG: folylpolyglutamate synthase/dihydrofolate synthase family protein [Flavobacteriaceae bacterium]
MNYNQTLDWLYAQLPMYQRVGGAAYKKDLSNTILLTAHLGNPERNFKSIHVAGTNGKGSVSHMLASVLQEAGYKVGLYTSPHLKDFRERIKINGQMIPKKKVTAFVKHHKSFFETHSLSFFEMTVGLAFDYFSAEQVDVAVIEVGMGGRLDSTNIITPEISVITNIGLDHTAFLGDTLSAIAKEKAGIIKQNTPVVIGESIPETRGVFEAVATEKNAEITFAEAMTFQNIETDLKGAYQVKNKQTAKAAIAVLNQKTIFKIPEIAIKEGLMKVVSNTGLMGRWQVLQTAPKVICDTAHNKEGLAYVLKQLDVEKKKHLHIVLGFVSDKNVEDVLELFPKKAHYYYCKPAIPRGLDVAILEDKASNAGLTGIGFSSVKKAFKAALKNAGTEDLIFVGGSTFVVAEII